MIYVQPIDGVLEGKNIDKPAELHSHIKVLRASASGLTEVKEISHRLFAKQSNGISGNIHRVNSVITRLDNQHCSFRRNCRDGRSVKQTRPRTLAAMQRRKQVDR